MFVAGCKVLKMDQKQPGTTRVEWIGFEPLDFTAKNSWMFFVLFPCRLFSASAFHPFTKPCAFRNQVISPYLKPLHRVQKTCNANNCRGKERPSPLFFVSRISEGCDLCEYSNGKNKNVVTKTPKT